MIQIANPIYDAVFKFMMNDNEVAKLLLSAIIGEKIKELTFQPTELPIPFRESITVLRMDFKAIIALEEGGTKTAIIEIQKAKLHTDIMRFRTYLGEQYKDKNNSKIIKRVKSRKEEGTWIEHRKAFPILSIYFLGHRLDHIKNVPVIKVARSYYDLGTGELLTEKEDFIESLTHDSYVIQIPYIKGHKRTELEQLLQIFDQEGADEYTIKHILTIQDKEIPVQYEPVIRRLLLAVVDGKTQKLMQVEDELLDELKQYNRALKDQEGIIAQREKEIEEKEKTIEEKEESLNRAIRKFIDLGLPDQEIATTLNIAIEQVALVREGNEN